jgi:hypothetical protein
VPRKQKPARKSAPRTKKKVVRAKKIAPKKKPLGKKKKTAGEKHAPGGGVVETFEVELVGASGDVFDDEDEGGEEDFPQEYGGSE